MEILAKFRLFNDQLPATTGVYAIANKLDGKLYIGSAASINKRPSQTGFRNRFIYHRSKLKGNRHHTKKLQYAFNKYVRDGYDPNDVFEIWILEYCPPEMCIEREQWYFDKYKPWYNSLPNAGSPLGHTKKPESIELFSKKTSIPTTLYYKPSDEYIEMEGIMRYTKNVNKDVLPGPLYSVKSGDLYQHRGFYLTKEYAYDKEKWEKDFPAPSSSVPGVMWSRLWKKWLVRPTHNKTVYKLGEYESEAEAIEVLLEFRKTHPAVSREVPKSGYKGVSWNSKQSKWKAQPCHSGKQYFLGYFKEEEDAIAAIEAFKLTLES